MRKATLTLLFVVGAALIAAPFAFSMWSRAGDGTTMVNSFGPIMQPASVKVTADYYDNVFTKLRPIALMMNQRTIARFDGYLAGLNGVQADVAKLVPLLAQALHTTPAQVQQLLAKQTPALAAMLTTLPQMTRDFGGLMGVMKQNVPVFARVPAGLDHYLPLVRTMQQNVGNYESVDALPRMSLFPWFFVIPGILIVLGSGLLLVGVPRRLGLHFPHFHRPLPH